MSGTKDPEISVIMPLYNKERYVAEAVQSVLNQSYDNLEVLVVDDKSTDGSLEIARHFESDDRLRILTNSQNRGPAYSENKGVRESKGRVIALIGADDVYHPDKLKIQMEEMSDEGQHKDVVVYTDWFAINEESQVTKPNHLDLKRIHSGNILGAILRHGGLLAAASMIFLKESALDVGLFDENLRIRADFDFSLKLARTRSFVGIPTPLYGYRIHDDSLIFRTPKRESYLVKLKIMEKHLGLNPELLSGEDGSEIMRQLARCLIASRSYKSALVHTLNDPRMLEAFYYCLKNR